MLTIAHRLHTVLQCDTVAVLAEGRVLEAGPPFTLLGDSQSAFHALAKEAGIVKQIT